MKLVEYQFSKESRKDTSLVDFINDINKIINFGRYQMRVVSTVPTHVGEEGEHLLYINGTVRRLYFYDITNSTWHFINWNTSGFAQATIVATVSLTAQTGNIGSTNIYVPSASGTFRVNVYQICSKAGSAGSLDSVIGWTDVVGAKTISPAGAVDLTSIANGSTGMSFIVTTAAAITYTTTITGGAGAPEYNLYIVLEALS